MILFNATSRRACALSDDKLTTGSVGIPVEFTFSDDWTAVPARIAVFRGSGQSVDVALLEDRCTVPPEVLTQPGSTLTIGVYGTDGAGTVVIPTVYAEAGQIKRGTEPSGIEPTPQTQPLIDQLLAAAQAARNAADEAERLAQSIRDDADAGEFDGEDGTHIWWTTARVLPYDSGGGVSTRQLNGVDGVTPAVRDYVFAPEIEQSGEPTTLYVITQTTAVATAFDRLCSIKGDPGADGSGVWYTTARVSGDDNPFVPRRRLIGREGATVQVHDLLFAPDVGDEGEPTTLYEITGIVGIVCTLKRLCKMQGEGGSGTVDDDFSETSENPVQNKVITAALNAALRQLQTFGLALDNKVDKVSGKGLSSNDFTDSDKGKLEDAASETWVQQQGYITDAGLGSYRTAADQDTIDQQQNAAIEAKYTKPGTGVPKTDLAAAVQTSLGKADTALQQHQDISGKADKVTEVTVATDGAVTQALDAGKVYHFTGALTSLTITLNAAGSGQLAQYHFDFDCGSTAPTVTIPNSVTMPSGNFEASKHYEVDILNNYGMVMAWATS